MVHVGIVTVNDTKVWMVIPLAD